MKTNLSSGHGFFQRAEQYRSFWVMGLLMLQGNVLIPVTLYTAQVFDAGFWQVVLCALASLSVLVSILSLQPVKTVLFTFAGSALLTGLLVGLNLFQ